MARTHTCYDECCVPNTSASTKTHSFKHNEMINTTEPWMARSIPTLIVIFLISITLGTWVNIFDGREDVLKESQVNLEFVRSLIALKLDQLPRDKIEDHESAGLLAETLSKHNFRSDYEFYLTNENGIIVATLPDVAGKTLASALNADFDTLGIRGTPSMAYILQSGDIQKIVATAPLKAPFGSLTVAQPVDDALVSWKHRTLTIMILMITAAIVMATLGIAYYKQAARAGVANLICGRLSSRIDVALNCGHCGLWDWDITSGQVYWSDSMYDLLGMKRESEFQPFSFINTLLHPDDANLFDFLKHLNETGKQAIDQEFRARHVSGRWIWLRSRAEVVYEKSTSSKHLIGIALDITEQKRLAEHTHAADQRLREAIESISEAFVLWDADNRLVMSNSKYRQLHGLKAVDALIGRSYSDIYADSIPLNVHSKITMGECPKSGAMTYEAQLQDGRWLQISERPTNCGGYVSVGTDITLLKQQGERLAESERWLLQTVSDLRQSRQTLEVQTSQLSDLADKYLLQKANAESANQAKSEFLANMSHELRTPLNAIIGFSQMMENAFFGPLGSERYVGYVKDIRASGNYLLNVIDDVLEMARIDSGRIHLDNKSMKLNGSLEKTLRKIVGVAEDKSIHIDVRVREDIILNADRRAVDQIFIHLLQNAVKFTPKNGSIRLRTVRVEDGVNVFIEDNGVGITPDMLNKLGQPFRQVGSHMDDGMKGSGLGFSIAKSLTELQGGRIRVRSRTGTGTIVMVHLPIARKAFSFQQRIAA